MKVFALDCLFFYDWGIGTLPAWKDVLTVLRKWSTNPDNLPNVDRLEHLVERELTANILEQYGLARFASSITPSLRPYIKSCKAFRSALRSAANDRFAEAQAKVKEFFNVDEAELFLLLCISFRRYYAEAEIREVCRKM
mgnify:FL=1